MSCQARPGQEDRRVDWTVPTPPHFLLPHPSPFLGPTCRPPVGMETGPYLAAGLVRVRGWRFVLV